MATYHAFAGLKYYPQSGLGDYVGGFGDLDEAISKAYQVATDEEDDWFVIVAQDSDTDQLVEVYRLGEGRVNEGANLS